MIPNLPLYIAVTFGLTVLATLLLFYRAVSQSTADRTRKMSSRVLIGLIGWLLIQVILTMSGVYTPEAAAWPPRIMPFGILPPLIGIGLVFATATGRDFTDSLPLTTLTWLNSVRVVVELVLYGLFLHRVVPQLMTFDGRNYDILAGLTAPLVAYFGFTKKQISRPLLLAWNIICLGLLLNIVFYALLSAPTAAQRFAFDQPNTAIFYFPFSWLPTFVVPIVLFGHLVSIRQLVKRLPV